MNTILRLLAVVTVAASIASAAPLLSLTLDSPVQLGGPGSWISYSGSLTNDSGSLVFLNAISGNTSYGETVLDYSPFFANVPLSLAPGVAYLGPFFAVAMSGIAQAGQYTGDVTIQGGIDDLSFDSVAVADFRVDVAGSSVPEPGCIGPVSLCLLLVTLVHRRIRR